MALDHELCKRWLVNVVHDLYMHVSQQGFSHGAMYKKDVSMFIIHASGHLGKYTCILEFFFTGSVDAEAAVRPL